MDLALRPLDEVAIPLEHRGHLLTLVRMDQKHDFVVSQRTPLGFRASRRAVRQGVKSPIVRSGGGASYSLGRGGSTGRLGPPRPARSSRIVERGPWRLSSNSTI